MPHKLRGYRFFCFTSFTFILLLTSFIFLRLTIAFYQAPRPQAILTLGGGPDREKFTAQFARMYQPLEIWVSSGIYLNEAKIFQTEGISDRRVHFDHRAVDTVTNFTSLVEDFKSRKIQHIYLITSDYHMPRAKVIATLVLGSQGITFTPVSVPSSTPPESWLEVTRDGGRALLWIFTGYTGASLNPKL